MDLFPHDKLTKYLANRPNFPPSPQVLSLKEESSEVKRLLKLGRAGGGFARCSEGGKDFRFFRALYSSRTFPATLETSV